MADTEGAKLTDKQAMFAQEYIVDLNATQAAIRAGYSEATAQEQGSRLLSNVMVAAAVQKAMDLRAERVGITADRVLVELAKIGFADIREIFTEGGQLRAVHTLPDGIAAAVQSVEVVTSTIGSGEDAEVEYTHKIKLADKKSSLELLGKHLKLFADRVEHTGKDGGAIEVADLSERELARRIAFALSKGSNAGNA